MEEGTKKKVRRKERRKRKGRNEEVNDKELKEGKQDS